MKLFQAVGEYFALDIGSSAVRVVQLRNSGNSYSLVRYGMVPVDPKMSLSDAPEDQKRLGLLVHQLVSQTGVSTNNVVVGVPTNKMFATVVDLPKVSEQEMATSIKYQAEQYIPMSLDEAKIDWTVLGDSPDDPKKNEVLLASVSNKFSEARVDMLENIGLNVVALVPDGLALCNSVLPTNTPGSFLVIDIGELATDIVAILGGEPRLIRSIPTGAQVFIKSAMQNLNIDEKQARQFVYKFGVAPDKIEGQIFKAVESTLELLVSEFQKSVKFFNSRYTNQPINQILMSGEAAGLPMLDKYFASKLNLNVTQVNVWQNVSYSKNAASQLAQLNNSFAVVVGLAETKL